MTEEKKDIVPVAAAPAAPVIVTFDDRAKAILSPADYALLRAYIDSGRQRIATVTSMKLYELFLSGSSVEEIWKLNQVFDRQAIQWARIYDKWDEQRDLYVQELQAGIKDRVLKAHMEAAELVSVMMAATNKRYGTQVKKYLQSGDVKDLDGVSLPSNVQGVMKAIEALQKITGQDRKVHVTKEETLNVNVNSTSTEGLSPEAAAKVLSIIAEERRKGG